jgi:hypothetical protein
MAGYVGKRRSLIFVHPMPRENRVRKQGGVIELGAAKRFLSRHSPQAYMIIKIIHLMNWANADTLAPINKSGALKPERRGIGSLSLQQICKSYESLREENSDRKTMGRKKTLATGRRTATSCGCD